MSTVFFLIYLGGICSAIRVACSFLSGAFIFVALLLVVDYLIDRNGQFVASSLKLAKRLSVISLIFMLVFALTPSKTLLYTMAGFKTIEIASTTEFAKSAYDNAGEMADQVKDLMKNINEYLKSEIQGKGDK